jgi:5-amino-6-(5-phospho-D-ribitylamino)uracil phosphatase
MLPYRLLAMDIDGTLVNSRDELTAGTRAALARVAAAGIQVVLATGRRYSRALELVEPLAIDVPLVTNSGALVKDPLDHRTLYAARFEPEVLCDAVSVIDRRGFEPLLCGDTFAEGFDYYQAPGAARTSELAEFLTLNPGCGRLWPALVDDPPRDVFAAFVLGSYVQMRDLEEHLHAVMPGKLTTSVLRSPRYRGYFCEWAPAGVSKWSAVCHLAERWGIDPAAICAVGDDVNDIPMIRAAGLGVAMGNALPAVKAAADRVAPSHDEEGVVELVEWLLKPEGKEKL